VVDDRLADEIGAGEGLQTGPRRDPRGDVARVEARSRLGEDERQHLPFRGGETDRLRVAGVDDGKALERLPGPGQPDDHRPPVVHLDRAAAPERLSRPEPTVPDDVQDPGVGDAQVVDAPLDHRERGADEGGVVEAEEDHLLVFAPLEPGPGDPLVEPHRPIHARDAADAVEVRVGHRLDVVDELDLRIHDPDPGPLDVEDLADG
ncbi:MAG: hypothetical protein ACK55I_07260, partial [bacterium]